MSQFDIIRMNEAPPEARTKHRGKWQGAGRKPNYLNSLGIKAISAAEILAHHNEPELWAGLLRHKSPDIRLTAEVVKNLTAPSGVAYKNIGAILSSLTAPNLAPKMAFANRSRMTYEPVSG